MRYCSQQPNDAHSVMAKDDPHFRLRIPAELKAEIENAARSNNRSINAEIVLRLHESFRPVGAGARAWTIILEALPPGTPSMEMTVGEFMSRFAAASAVPDFIATSPSGETTIVEVKSMPENEGNDRLRPVSYPTRADREAADIAAEQSRVAIKERRIREAKNLARKYQERQNRTDDGQPDE